MNGKLIIHNERVVEFDEPAEVLVVQLRIVSVFEYKPAIVFVSCLRSTIPDFNVSSISTVMTYRRVRYRLQRWVIRTNRSFLWAHHHYYLVFSFTISLGLA